MTSTAFSRRTKALTIVPLAMLSGAWTVSLVSTSAGASGDESHKLPDGSSVLTKAIEAPASIPQPGVIAPGVPAGSADQVVSSASSSGIPSAAIAAYQRGSQIINAADKSCNIPWELIAAIGRVESNHGRYGGNTLNDKGVAVPGIYGISLNGKNNTQAISDTDGGQLDKDTVYDRAVGPMQFIPSTWAVVKVDADGDGQRNPQDIDDAALATAVYLCSGDENLSERKGQETAVYRYNHSKDYVNLVLRLMEAYQQGQYTAVPSGSYGGSVFSPSYASAIDSRRANSHAKSGKAGKSLKAGKKGTTGTTAPNTGGTSTVTPGGSTNTGSNPVTGEDNKLPGTSGGGVLGDVVDGVKGTVDGLTGGSTGGSTGSTPSPTPTIDPVKTLTQAQATAQCLAQVGASSLTSLLDNPLNALKLTNYKKCMDGLGF